MKKKRPVRRSQLISPFGVGAIVDFRGPESLMTAGLDAWPNAKQSQEKCLDVLILEERLQARLGKTHFRLPPHFDEDSNEINQLIPFIRFPLWQYCPEQICGAMRKSTLYEARSQCHSERCMKRPEKYRPWLMPVRIITICPKGHIDDFPFFEWVHSRSQRGPDCSLTWKATGTSSALSEIMISCSCGSFRSLQGAFTFSTTKGGALHTELTHDCTGRRPWLGEAGNGCGEFLRVVQRGATNVYFPVVKSAIYLPSAADDIDEWMSKIVDEIVRKCHGQDDEHLRKMIGYKALFDGLDEKQLTKAVEQRLARDKAQPRNISEEEFRYEEFQVLRGDELSPGKDLKLKEFPIQEYKGLGKYFERIRLVTKLRETRVLESFTRITPLDNGQSTPQELSLDPAINWLPAIIVRGEGIFFEFKNDSFPAWERKIASRVADFRSGYEDSVRRQDARATRLTARFVLLHTFAHLMIRELTFECGYGSAALRERIYCDIDGSPMNGVLIYTASGDSEGTLGGLIRQAHPDRLQRCFHAAISKAQWCSGDPVCIESVGQGINNANLAACHGCALLPETCCEQGNMLLDRALLIGRPKDRNLGFFT